MNVMRGAVPFTTDGRERYIRLTTNAQVRYQERAGETFIAGVTAMQEEEARGDMRRVRCMIWAGLGHEGLSEEAAGDLIDDLGLTEASRLLGEAIRAAFPELDRAAAQAEAEAEAASGNAPEPAKRKPKPAEI